MEVIKTDGTTVEFDTRKITEAVLAAVADIMEEVDEEFNAVIQELIHRIKHTLSNLHEFIRRYLMMANGRKENLDRSRMHTLIIAALLLSCVKHTSTPFMLCSAVFIAVLLHKCGGRESDAPLPVESYFFYSNTL